MSGKPNPQDVYAVDSAIRRMVKARERIRVLADEVRTKNTEIENQQTEFNQARELVWKRLTEMDLVSSGNVGFQDRMFAFLMFMVNGKEQDINASDSASNPEKRDGRLSDRSR